ncbi:hypothetical protein [Streptomyces lydicus]|uniref:hypothetical protein n=1 Tax=Streptomyces lydicus TaxID=47763 RepID=UPI000525D9D4|nr:hypothetical protein [Streptomyces lydicus]UEG93895.1 hypothetical protein LJ741_27145 [Streptomyces lydicus]
MFHYELEMRVRYEELRREAQRQHLVREARAAGHAGRAAGRSGENDAEGRVSSGRGGRWRVRRAAA